MRIVGGRMRGTHLAPVGEGDASAHLRPTSDRVREAIFNLLINGGYGSPLADARVLDLFAGTGALGLEAISRGALKATFVDDGVVSRGLLRRNIEITRTGGVTDIYRRDATKLGLNRAVGYGMVFLDPPYGKSLGERALASCIEGNWLAEDALIVWEEGSPPVIPQGLDVLDQRSYGETTVTILRRMMDIRAVIFDCDGVLVDSEPETFRLLAEDLEAAGLTLSMPEMEALFLGGTIPGVFRAARQLGADLPENWVKTFYDRLYARLARGTPLVEGVSDVLDWLDASDIPYAVGSNGTTEKMLTTLGQHPDVIQRLRGKLFSGQELNMPKPDPGLYRHVAQFLGVSPARCAVVEDSPTGARAARLAGMCCFGYAPHGNDKLADEGAILFADMAELPGLLAGQ